MLILETGPRHQVIKKTNAKVKNHFPSTAPKSSTFVFLPVSNVSQRVSVYGEVDFAIPFHE